MRAYEVTRDYNANRSFNECRLPMFSNNVESAMKAILEVSEKTAPGYVPIVKEYDSFIRVQINLANGHCWLLQVSK